VDPGTITTLGDWIGGWLERNPVIFLTIFFFGTTCLMSGLLLRCGTRTADVIKALQDAKDARIITLERQIEAKEKDTRILETINQRDAALQAQIDQMAAFMRGSTGTSARRRKAADDDLN
jgi:hypothetical protein